MNVINDYNILNHIHKLYTLVG